MKQHSFTQVVKEELCSNIYESQDRLRALLAAYIRIDGSIILRGRKSYLQLSTENAKIAKFIYQTINEIYKVETELSYKTRQNGSTLYVISVDESNQSIIDDLEISFLEGKISKNIVRNDDTISGYLAGAFLASGSVNSPETSNYHLEISLNNENYAKWLTKLFYKYKKIEMNPRIIKRREKSVIYFKKSDQISNFLIMVGAPETCMEFEDERVKRDYINSENRLINFDEANMRRASQIGRRQAKEIKFIDDVLGIHNLHNVKKELLCYLRMEYKEISMVELAEMMSDELGTVITKSNVNHLFRSLHELYIELQGVKRR